MAKRKTRSVLGLVGVAVGDIVDAASIAATGSQLGVLELAAEEELSPTPSKRNRKTKMVRKKKKVVAKSKKNTKKKRGVKRRPR